MWSRRCCVAFLVSLLLLVGCKSRQSVGDTSTAKEDAFTVPFQTLSTKCEFEFMSMGQVPHSLNSGKTFTINGQLKIHTDSLILLSVQPLAGIEVARLFFTKEGMTLLDRMHKSYVRMSYTELSDQFQVDMNYHSLMSIFCAILFAVEKDEPAKSIDFSKTALDNRYFWARSYKGISQEFNTDTQNRLLNGAVLGASGYIRWSYDEYKEGKVDFPMKTSISVKGSMNSPVFAISMLHRKVEMNVPVTVATNIPASYKQVSIQEVVEMIENGNKQ